MVLVLEVLLRLASLRPSLHVSPIDHSAFFVEEPPAEAHGEGQEEAGQRSQQHQQWGAAAQQAGGH